MKIALGILAALVIAGAAAAGGYFYGKDVGQKAAVANYQSFVLERMGAQPGGAVAAQPGGQVPGAQGQPFQRQGQGEVISRGAATGQVTRVEEGKVTLSTSTGEVVVLVGGEIALRKSVTIALKDLAVGETLTVIGDRDAQGNLVARTVQVGDMQQFFGGALPGGTPLPGGAQPGGNIQRRATQTAP